MQTDSIDHVHSLFGKPLAIDHAVNGEWLAKLSFAREAFEKDPSVENAQKLGRVLSSGQRVNEAIAVYTRGLERHANSVLLYRLRGHRYISARKFDRAIADFEKALQLMQLAVDEPITASLKFDVWYHLGLAHFLKGEYKRAVAAYGECLKECANDSDVIACADWYYMALRRDGRHEEAVALLDRIDGQMDAGENEAYFRRLLAYKGDLAYSEVLREGDDMEFVTSAFGIANELLTSGDDEEAFALIDRILATGAWMGFAYIAAEADAHRRQLV